MVSVSCSKLLYLYACLFILPLDLFKEQWEKQVRVLTDAVDDITSIDDFLAVSGNDLVP